MPSESPLIFATRCGRHPDAVFRRPALLGDVKHAWSWSLQESYAVVCPYVCLCVLMCAYVFVGVFARGIGLDDDRPPLAHLN